MVGNSVHKMMLQWIKQRLLLTCSSDVKGATCNQYNSSDISVGVITKKNTSDDRGSDVEGLKFVQTAIRACHLHIFL